MTYALQRPLGSPPITAEQRTDRACPPMPLPGVSLEEAAEAFRPLRWALLPLEDLIREALPLPPNHAPSAPAVVEGEG